MRKYPDNPPTIPTQTHLSGSIGLASFFNSVDFVVDGNGCCKVCHSITTTLIGLGIGAAIEKRGDFASNPISITVGSGKYFGVATNGHAVSFQYGASISAFELMGLPVDLNLETTCFKITEKDINGCPCPD